MRFNLGSKDSSTDYAKHLRRFNEGFPWNTLDLYVGLMFVYAVTAFVLIKTLSMDGVTAQELPPNFTEILMAPVWLFFLLPILRGVLFVVISEVRDRVYEVNMNE